MHHSKEDLDRFYSNTPKLSHARGASNTITVPPHGVIPAVYTVEAGDYFTRSQLNDATQEPSTIHKSVKMAFILIVLTVLLVGFIFATLSVTRLTKS